MLYSSIEIHHHRLSDDDVDKLQKRTTRQGDEYGALTVPVVGMGVVGVGYSLETREMISQTYQPIDEKHVMLAYLDSITHKEYFRHVPQAKGYGDGTPRRIC